MSDFVDPNDGSAVEAVLRDAISLLGAQAVVAQLAAVVPVRVGRPAGLMRRAEPTLLQVDDQALSVAERGPSRLQHVVGGVVLSSEQVTPVALPGVVAALLRRSLAGTGLRDELSVLLTALRDAVSAGR